MYMARAQVKKRRSRAAPAIPITPAAPEWPRRLTQLAFLLTLVLVIVRMSMEEILRGAWLPVPGSTPLPAIPGPATSIGLDLLCCVPALLVFARRVFDPSFSIRFAWSFVAMFGLAVWTPLSVLWASDRFAALVSAFGWCSALMLLWSTAQLVHSGLRLRLVAATSFGLLLLLLVQGYYYRFIDLPDLQQNWRQHHSLFLTEQGATSSSINAGQIEKNIMGGVPTGFNVSRNSYAAVLVLLMVIAAGIILQRRADGDASASWIAIVPAIVLGLVMLYAFVQSKTAFATPIIAAALLALLWRKHRWISEHARRMYWWTVGFFALLIAAVVGHGLKHGTLVHVSLTFRWQYWVGAARVFMHRPWLGTGWANFGSWYTAYRLPQAAEEPTDPHNFLVRAFVELGLPGGLLMIAWMLRVWWEWSVNPGVNVEQRMSAQAGAERSAASDQAASYAAFPVLISLALVAMAANAALSIDWTISSALIIVELFRRFLFLLALLTGLCLVSIRSFRQQVLDDRAAPWILAAVLVGLGLFLVHNLIDFSMFETGLMFFFALLAGTALGMRLPRSASAPSARFLMIVPLAGAGLLWIIAGAFVWIPIVQAESLAVEADEQIRSAKPIDAPPQMRADPAAMERARDALIKAFDLVPYNGDYAFRAEQTGLLNGIVNPTELRAWLNAAIADNPRMIRYLNARATLETLTGDWLSAVADYDRILQLDPHNLELRLRYAALLDQLGKSAEAVKQYRIVLENNDRLAPDEIRRLTPKRAQEIRARINRP